MRKRNKISRNITLVCGLIAAVVVVSTSFFQFSLQPVYNPDTIEVLATSSELPSGASDNADEKNGAPHTPNNVCTIQALSHGVQLQVNYDPISLEVFNVDLPELSIEVPGKVYAAGWEFFKVLFRDIISPNAP